jgi:hypothetical protein
LQRSGLRARPLLREQLAHARWLRGDGGAIFQDIFISTRHRIDAICGRSAVVDFLVFWRGRKRRTVVLLRVFTSFTLDLLLIGSLDRPQQG